MLVLTRRKEEALLIDDRIRVVILETRKDRVKVGIQAPRDVNVVRTELRDCRTKENPGEPAEKTESPPAAERG